MIHDHQCCSIVTVQILTLMLDFLERPHKYILVGENGRVGEQ